MTVAYPRRYRNRMSARDIMGRIVQEREVHLVTLNRYRYNEQRSCKDLTDVIERLDGEPPDLVRDLSRHVADEARHALWLTELLLEIGGDVGTPPGLSYIEEFERLVDADSYRDPAQKEEAMISSLAAINVTEKRGCEYFSAHLHALRDAEPTEENARIRDTIARILPEEIAHVRWGTQQLATIARRSPAHRRMVERARAKHAAIEHAAYETGMDITLGAEWRRARRVFDIAGTLPVLERPGYLLEHLPHALLDPALQMFRIEAAGKAWRRDPDRFFRQFLPLFFNQATTS